MPHVFMLHVTFSVLAQQSAFKKSLSTLKCQQTSRNEAHALGSVGDDGHSEV
jgi:hypothetical protein